jgi:YD repeat-containing protein
MFGYDSVDRLTSVNNGGSGESYAYDDVGNRTSSHLASSYGYQAGQFNRLVSAVTPSQTISYSYDANGNMVRKAEGSNFWQYSWDHENRLTEAAARRDKVRYKYDALGRRVRRFLVGNREHTKFTYDGHDVLVDDDFGTLTKYLNGPGIDNKLRTTTGSTASYFLADHLGSTNGLADFSGALIASNSYDSFGNPSNSSFRLDTNSPAASLTQPPSSNSPALGFMTHTSDDLFRKTQLDSLVVTSICTVTFGTTRLISSIRWGTTAGEAILPIGGMRGSMSLRDFGTRIQSSAGIHWVVRFVSGMRSAASAIPCVWARASGRLFIAKVCLTTGVLSSYPTMSYEGEASS